MRGKEKWVYYFMVSVKIDLSQHNLPLSEMTSLELLEQAEELSLGGWEEPLQRWKTFHNINKN